ncbi:chorismate mutase [Streptomyces sp. IBSNAI002]|uniref:chorismate mutase n=1 Tax=Streptomyces sp. IBSNAI002 TaxID=3457500 RepID=UPI003FD19DC9
MTARTTDSGLTELVRAAAQRLLTADQVAAAKWISGAPIDDPDREQEVLDAMDAEAVRLGIDRHLVQRIFRDQIEASKCVQHHLHDRWRTHSAEGPAMAPDLGAVREEINRLNTCLLLTGRDAQALLSGPRCAARREHARLAVARDLRLPPVHTRALHRALTSLCIAHV